jgi:nitroreductase
LEAIEAIFSRRSIRKYDTEKQVSDKEMDILIRAGMQAPSAMNIQPWHFVVIKERNIIDQIPAFHTDASMLKYASLVIAVCGNIGESPYFWDQDCSAATENILLAAHALGLGAVWLGTYPIEDRINGTKKLLDIPDDIMPFSLISIGRPLEPKPFEDKFNPERLHFNKW